MPSYMPAGGRPVLQADTPPPAWTPGQTTVRPPTGGAPRNQAQPWGAGITPYSSTNNLIGSQIGPGESAGTKAATNRATNAQTALSNFQFTPYSPTATADYSQSQHMLTGANTNYQNAALNYGAANNAYGQAQATQAGARQQGQNALQGVQNMGMAAYQGGGGSGGAAARADTTGLKQGLAESNAMIGPAYGDAADTQRARALTAQQLEKSMSAPDRGALGAEYLKLYEERSQPGYEASLRSSKQANAAMGRRGSGMVTSELSDIAATRERDIAQQRRQLAADAAGATLSDNLNLTNAGLGVTQGFGAEDRAGVSTRLNQAGQRASNANSDFNAEATNAGFQDAAYGRMEQAAGRNAAGAQAYASNQSRIADQLYGMGADQAAGFERYGGVLAGQENNRVGLIGDQATFQRGTANDLAGLQTTNYNQRDQQNQRGRQDEYDQFGVTRDRASDLTGYQNDERTYDANNRNELRTERTFQTGRADKALQDEYDRLAFDDQMRNSEFDRNYRTASLGYGAPSPGTVYGQQAGRYQEQANGYGQLTGSAAELLGYGTQRRTGAGTGR